MYRHTQIGWMILGTCGGIALWFGFVALLQGRHDPSAAMPMALPCLFLLVIAVLFGTLTVQVDDQQLLLWFGPGLIRKRIRLADVSTCETVRNPWPAGWGVRWIGSGWLYNVSGLDAVQFSMRNGTVYRIGTDEPLRLDAAISARLTP
jgi:hypothetical protein